MKKRFVKTVLLIGGPLVLVGLAILVSHQSKNLPLDKKPIEATRAIKKPAPIDNVKKNRDLPYSEEPVRADSSPLPRTPGNEPIKEPVSADSSGNEQIKALVDDLKNRDWRIQVKARERLVNIGKPAVPGLMTALQKKDISPPAKAMTIIALGKIGDPRAVDLLVAALSDANSYTRRCAVEALGKTQDPKGLDPLINALSDKDVTVRQRAVNALGKLNDARASMPLIAKLSDEDVRVRTSAIKTLATLGDQGAVEPLMEQLGEAHDQSYKNEIVRAFGQLGDKRALPVLEYYLQRLKARKPLDEDPMIIFAWQTAVNLATEAILKLQQ